MPLLTSGHVWRDNKEQWSNPPSRCTTAQLHIAHCALLHCLHFLPHPCLSFSLCWTFVYYLHCIVVLNNRLTHCPLLSTCYPVTWLIRTFYLSEEEKKTWYLENRDSGFNEDQGSDFYSSGEVLEVNQLWLYPAQLKKLYPAPQSFNKTSGTEFELPTFWSFDARGQILPR